MKKIFLFLFLFSTTYTHEAQNWCNLVIKSNPSNEDMTLLLNLLYWSYQRSESTCSTQDLYCSYVENCLQAGQTIHHTRRNPSLQAPYKNLDVHLVQKQKPFLNALKNYHETNATYVACTDFLLAAPYFHQQLHNLVKELRKKARNAVLHEISSPLNSLHNTYSELKSLLNSSGKTAQKRSLTSTINSLAQLYSLKSLVQFDKTFVHITKQWWQTLLNAYELNNVLWKTIEKRRANFYKTYYNALYNMVLLEKTQKYMISFDHKGFIYKNERTEELPLPSDL